MAGLDKILAATTLRRDAHMLRRAGLVLSGIAMACALVAGITAYQSVHDDGAGVVWTGGLIVAAAFGFRAVQKFRLAGQFAPPMPTVNVVALGAAALLALVPAVMAGMVLTGAIPTADDASNLNLPSTGAATSSCWTALDSAGITKQVACSRPDAKLIGVTETSTPEQTCTDIYVKLNASLYLCLSPR